MTRRRVDLPGRRREQGAALVLVLSVVAVLGLLAAHLATVSEVAAREAFVAAERLRLRYRAESMVDRARWLHAVDRRLFPDRSMGVEAANQAVPDWERWQSDATPHADPGGPGAVRIRDADRGLDPATSRSIEELITARSAEDEASDDVRALQAFLDVYTDYVDPDSIAGLSGLEETGYAAMGLRFLPRDGPLQFREEIYWMPGSTVILNRDLRRLPPQGATFPKANAPPFFSASAAEIRSRGEFTEAQLEQVLEARSLWHRERLPLNETLDPAMMGRIRSRFSLRESGLLEIRAEAAAADGRIVRRCVVVCPGDLRPPTSYSDRERTAFSLWERRLE